MTRALALIVAFVALASATPVNAQVPVRLVTQLGDPVPADANAEIDDFFNSSVGPSGEVVFIIRSSSNQRFPSQPLLDLRRATSVDTADEQILMPILGPEMLRDVMIDGYEVNADDVETPRFQHDGHLLFDARVVPPGEVADAKAVIIRSEDGVYQVAYLDRTRDVLTTSDVQVDAMGRILVNTPLDGHWFAGDNPTQLYDPASAAPWDPNELMGAYVATALDDGRVALCCFEGAPVLWNAGSLSLTDPTPPTTDPVPQLATHAIHRSGRTLYTDTARDMMDNPYNAAFVGQVGSMANLVGPNFRDDLCATGFNIAQDVSATTNGFFFTSPCIGAVNPTERFLGPGDALADNHGTLTSIDFLDALVSDDGSKVAFMGNATSPTGDYRALFLVDDLVAGAQAEPVAIIGEGAAEMPDFLYSSILPTGINNEGHVTFEADVQDPTSTLTRALFVVNQQPLDVVPEADLEAIGGRLQVAGEQLVIEADVLNNGPVSELVRATIVVTGFTEELPIEEGDCAWSDGPTLMCELVSGDPEGLIPDGVTATLRAAVALPETLDVASSEVSFTVEGDVADPDTANNTALLELRADSEVNGTLQVSAERAGDEVELVMTVTNWGRALEPRVEYELAVSDGILAVEPGGSCQRDDSDSRPDQPRGFCDRDYMQPLSTTSFELRVDAVDFSFDFILYHREFEPFSGDFSLKELERETGRYEFGSNPDTPRSDENGDADLPSGGCAHAAGSSVPWSLLALIVVWGRVRRRQRLT